MIEVGTLERAARFLRKKHGIPTLYVHQNEKHVRFRVKVQESELAGI